MSLSARLPTLMAVIALLAAACSGGNPVIEQAAVIAATADGGQLDFGSLEGTDTVLWFWAPW